jgi:hypothetical protein
MSKDQKYAQSDFIVVESAGATTRENAARDRGGSALPHTAAQPAGFLRRVFEAFGRMRRRHAELYLGRSLNLSGARLTDDLERRLARTAIQNAWF